MVAEKKGVAFTSGINKDGWQISVTERADSSVEAYANLEKTIATMVGDGIRPFVSYYNRAELEDKRESKYPDDSQEPVSVLAQAKQLGGVTKESFPITPEEEASIASGVDGFQHSHGLLERKPAAPDLAVGDSFQIIVDAYKRPTRDKVEFYNEHSQYPAAAQNLKGKGGEIFLDLFPSWTPEVGTEGSIEPVKLSIVGGGQTSQGNAYQNIKSVEPA